MAKPQRALRSDAPVSSRELADAVGCQTQFIADECSRADGELHGAGQSWKVGKRNWRIDYHAAVTFLRKRNLGPERLRRQTA